jgi:hypothetical protein
MGLSGSIAARRAHEPARRGRCWGASMVATVLQVPGANGSDISPIQKRNGSAAIASTLLERREMVVTVVE